MSQKTDLTDAFGLELNRFGFPVMQASNTHATASEGIFAAGDCITGTKSVILGVQGGREAASEVDIYLGGDGDIDEVLYERPAKNPNIGHRVGFNKIPREELVAVPLEERARTFNPVEYGFTDEQVACESERCLQCDLRCDLQRVKMWTEY